MKGLLNLLIAVAGCATRPATSPRLEAAEQELRDAIVLRDTKILDLASVGQNLVTRFGAPTARRAVLEIWNELTAGAPITRACDVMWLQERGAHTQCAGWLLCYEKEWLTP